ncbi:MAG: hypothetical protein IKR80_03925 [Spirochaetales bacterium]|nr:hypothetical protein [Spirochaetales bacterium]MBR6348083.1 hypothetical protein [Spirochaetales bacterium]
MFNNIGGKIKGLAKFMCWLGIILSVIIGVIMIIAAASSRSYTFDSYGEKITLSTGGSIVAGILIIVFGSLASWIGSFFMYGFGELVENSKKVADRVSKS